MIADFLFNNWKQILDLIFLAVVGTIVLSLLAGLLAHWFVRIRTRLWKPEVGDVVITLGLIKCKQKVVKVFEDGTFRCSDEAYSPSCYGSSTWDKKSVVFLEKGAK